MRHDGDAVVSDGKDLQVGEFFHFRALDVARSIANVHRPLTRRGDAHARAATLDLDDQVGIHRHERLGQLFGQRLHRRRPRQLQLSRSVRRF